jgi:hypothetical protein
MSDEHAIHDPPIRRAPLGELRIFQVYEHDLDRLGDGASGGILLNIGLSSFSVGGSFLVTLLSVDLTGNRVAFDVFLVLCTVFMVAGVICLALSIPMLKSTRSLIADIKRQMDRSPVQGSVLKREVAEALIFSD